MLRRPIWALGTLICLGVVVLFVSLGFWQLRRLHERQASNHLVATRMTDAPIDVASLEGPGTDPDPTAIQFRRVKVTGRWLPGSTILVRSRALNEIPGFHVLGILVLDDPQPAPGAKPTAVVVNRGFAPLGPNDPDIVIPAVAPTSETAEIEGVLRLSETRARLGPKDPVDGVLEVVNRVDVPRLQQQTPEVELEPLFVQQILPATTPTSIIATLPLPDVGNDGPHLSYAFQWFLFASVGVVGWPLLLNKASKEHAQANGAAGPDPLDGPGDGRDGDGDDDPEGPAAVDHGRGVSSSTAS